MIGLMWFLLGMFTTASGWGYSTLAKHYRLNWQAKLGYLSAFGLTWLCIGWSWASFAEGEPQAGAMGMLWFGLPALFLSVVTHRNLAEK